MAASAKSPPERRQSRPEAGEATAPVPHGEYELDLDTEWDRDWPEDDDGDWSGCANDGDGEHG